MFVQCKLKEEEQLLRCVLVNNDYLLSIHLHNLYHMRNRCWRRMVREKINKPCGWPEQRRQESLQKVWHQDNLQVWANATNSPHEIEG